MPQRLPHPTTARRPSPRGKHRRWTASARGLPPLPCWSGPVTGGLYRGRGPPLPTRWRGDVGSGVWQSPMRSSTPQCTPRVHRCTPVRTLPHRRPGAVCCAPCTTPPTHTPVHVSPRVRRWYSPHIRHGSPNQMQNRHHFPVNSLMHPAHSHALTTRREVIFCHHGHNHPTSR